MPTLAFKIQHIILQSGNVHNKRLHTGINEGEALTRGCEEMSAVWISLAGVSVSVMSWYRFGEHCCEGGLVEGCMIVQCVR